MNLGRHGSGSPFCHQCKMAPVQIAAGNLVGELVRPPIKPTKIPDVSLSQSFVASIRITESCFFTAASCSRISESPTIFPRRLNFPISRTRPLCSVYNFSSYREILISSVTPLTCFRIVDACIHPLNTKHFRAFPNVRGTNPQNPWDQVMSRRRSRSPSPVQFSRTCSSTDPREMERRIFVGNLPTSDMDKKDLEDLFGPYGKILGQ